MVCIPLPEDTVNDRLLKTRIVVFAGEYPDWFYVLAKDGGIDGVGYTENVLNERKKWWGVGGSNARPPD